MPLRINLTGQRFGRLTVVVDLGRRNGGVIWRCICSCGKLTEVVASSLRSGNTKSCGCLPRERIAEMGKNSRINLTGQRFGRLLVIRDSRKRTECGHVIWLCKCSCGKRVKIISGNLRYGHTRSCGCLKREQAKALGIANVKHGENDKNSKLYRTWQDMKRKCYNPNAINFSRYGGRGIRVCKKWLDKKVGYISFRAWALNQRYFSSSGLFFIARKDRRKGYGPDNCWLTRKGNWMNRMGGSIESYRRFGPRGLRATWRLHIR